MIEFEVAQDPVDVLEGSLRRQDVDRPELEVVEQTITGHVQLSVNLSAHDRVCEGPYRGREDPRTRVVSQHAR